MAATWETVWAVLEALPGTEQGLVHENSTTFYVTPHYQSCPGVIVRLATVPPDQLRELLTDAWRRVAPKRLVRELDQP